MPRGKPFKPGQSGNVKGRPKGIIDRRQRLQKALSVDSASLLAALTTKALVEGDVQAHALLINRYMPALKPEGSPIRFALDATLPTSKQIEAVMQALADGQLTVDEAKQVAEMIRLLAEARTADGAGENAHKLVDAFKGMAQFLANNDSPQPVASAPDLPPDTCPTA